VLTGSNIEVLDFWQGVTTREGGVNWLDSVACVVQPSLMETRPARLLQALAAGIPVVTTAACGLDGQEGVTIVPFGDSAALRTAIERHIGTAEG
jgi:glycosyltransferase involved in cell wall biosynthesis